MATKTAAAPWINSIVGYRLVPPADLLANPRNARRHPNVQRDTMRASLRSLGWIAPVINNLQTQTLLDGHLRIEEALSAGVELVPVIDVDLTPEQEALALATFDPIAAMAAYDQEALDALLREVDTGEAALQGLLESLATRAGLIPPNDPLAEWQGMPAFEHEDQTAHQTIQVHFPDAEAVTVFASLLGQQITPATKAIWYPPSERIRYGEVREV